MALNMIIPARNSRFLWHLLPFSALSARCLQKVCHVYSVRLYSSDLQIKNKLFQGVTRFQDHPNNEKNEKFYFWIALFNVSATVTSIMALQWIPYPTQVIAKGKNKHYFSS